MSAKTDLNFTQFFLTHFNRNMVWTKYEIDHLIIMHSKKFVCQMFTGNDYPSVIISVCSGLDLPVVCHD